MKLITETLEECKLVIEEGANGGPKSFFIEGPFLEGNVKNRNGRLYPVGLLEREVGRYTSDYVNQNRAYGELGHPQGPTINLGRVSHMIKSLKREADHFVGRAKIMDPPYGQIVQNLMKEGAKLGVSSRGMGSLKQHDGYQEVQDDYYLATAADIVADPSAPNAFVQGIMENREWIYSNGVLQEVELEASKEVINTAVRRGELEDTMISIFEDFINQRRVRIRKL
jgi:hypothetical protein